MTSDDRTPYARRAAVASGVGVTALGALVLLAWHTDNVRIIRVTLTARPMQYNTALCFLLAGLSLCAPLVDRPRWGAGLAAALIAIAGATLAQYVGAYSFGIDELVVRDYVQTGAAWPGRMAPNTAVCFLATGLGLLLACGLLRTGQKGLFLGLCGSFVAALALVALAGYAIRVSAAYAWSGLASMALHTATGFLGLGVALVLVGWDASRAPDGSAPRWLPVPVTGLVLTASLFLWQALTAQQSDVVQRGSAATLAQVEGRIDQATRDYGRALARMAERWENEGGTPLAVWTRDAQAYARDYPGERALAWADASMRIRRVEPLQGNRGLYDLDLSRHPAASSALESARRQGQVRSSDAFDAPDIGAVSQLCAPIFVDNASDGYVIAVLSREAFLRAVVDERIAAAYDVAFFEANGDVARLGDVRDPQDPWTASAAKTGSGVSAALAVWPKAQTVAAMESALPNLVLLVGMLMAASSALVVYYAQAAGRTTRALEGANVELTAARERSEGRLNAVVETAADGIVTATDAGIIESFNPAAERMFGYAAREVIGQNLRTLMPEPDRSAHDGYMQRYAESGVSTVVGLQREVLARRKEGSTFAIQLSVSEMSLPDGTRFAGIIRDITDMKRLDAQRTQLLHRVMTMQEVERARVAEGLHEQIGQELTAVVLGLRAVEASGSLEDARAYVADLRGQATKTIEDVRQMAVEMRPGSLADLGIGAVLQTDIDALAAREGIDATVLVEEPHALALSKDAQLSLYRIIHAALENVVDHAGARHVSVTIRPQDGRVHAMVEDDGVGFETDALGDGGGPVGVGLLAMGERAKMMGGSVHFESTPGEGAVVFIDVPSDVGGDPA